jgi:hypothetical protein
MTNTPRVVLSTGATPEEDRRIATGVGALGILSPKLAKFVRMSSAKTEFANLTTVSDSTPPALTGWRFFIGAKTPVISGSSSQFWYTPPILVPNSGTPQLFGFCEETLGPNSGTPQLFGFCEETLGPQLAIALRHAPQKNASK